MDNPLQSNRPSSINGSRDYADSILRTWKNTQGQNDQCGKDEQPPHFHTRPPHEPMIAKLNKVYKGKKHSHCWFCLSCSLACSFLKWREKLSYMPAVARKPIAEVRIWESGLAFWEKSDRNYGNTANSAWIWPISFQPRGLPLFFSLNRNCAGIWSCALICSDLRRRANQTLWWLCLRLCLSTSTRKS